MLEDVRFDMTTESQFELAAGGEEGFKVSYFDYFTKRYRLEISQVKQPMVKAPRKDRVSLELVEAMGWP